MMKKTSLELPDELWKAAKRRAIDDDVDLRTIIISALEKYLGVKATKPDKEGKHAR